MSGQRSQPMTTKQGISGWCTKCGERKVLKLSGLFDSPVCYDCIQKERTRIIEMKTGQESADE